MFLNGKNAENFLKFLFALSNLGMRTEITFMSVCPTDIRLNAEIFKDSRPVGALQVYYERSTGEARVTGNILPDPDFRPTREELMGDEFASQWLRAGLDQKSIE